MLNIPDNYYDAEIRNGFYIESKMKGLGLLRLKYWKKSDEYVRIITSHFLQTGEHFLVQYATMDLFHGTMIWI